MSAKKAAGGWTKKTRGKVFGSRTPHPLDAKDPGLADDWETIVATMATLSVGGGKGAAVAKRALAVAEPPKTLDAAVERARLALIKPVGDTREDPVVPAVLRTWGRVGGPAFFWEVLSAPSAEFECELRTKEGMTVRGPRRFQPKDVVSLSARDQLWATLRRLAFALPEPDWKAFRKAAGPALKAHADARVLIYVNAREPSLGATRARAELGQQKKTANQWAAGTAEVLASLHDPSLALEYVTALSPNFVGRAAFDVVELLGAAAAEVLQIYLGKEGNRSDKLAVEAEALARTLET